MVDGDMECLNIASPTELILLSQQLGVDLDESDPSGLPAEVARAFSRLSMRDLSRRLTDVQVDSSMCKERKDLENLLAQSMLTRLRSVTSTPVSTPEVPLHQRSASSERGRGVSVPPAGGTNGINAGCASCLVATGLSGVSVLDRSTQLEVGELEIGSGAFDPTQPSMSAQLASLLGVSKTCVIEEMTGFRGGLNEGVWFLGDDATSREMDSSLVLKLVKCTRLSESILTEAENFVKMSTDNPKIEQDPSVAFPVRMLKCLGPRPERVHRYDLIIMWKVKGERLAELIAHKWYKKAYDELWTIFERLGETLSQFHFRYGESQHGDFQPSNVFYDEETGDISLIDIGGMGVPTSETDLEHFSKSLKLLADVYGSQLLLSGLRSFEKGYDNELRSR